MTDAYQQGREAYLRGDDISLNPYDERDDQFTEWEDGFYDDGDEDSGFSFGNKPDTPFRLHQSYEKPGSVKQVRCAKCGRSELEVGQGCYFTVIRCPVCKHEACIANG